MWRWALLGVLVAIGSSGCSSRMAVRKVPPDERGDHVHGFRYYLSRPYVVVQDKVLVSETLRLVQSTKDYKIEPLKSQTLEITAGGKVKELDAAEAAAIRQWLEQGSGVVAAGGQTDGPPGAVSPSLLDTSPPGTIPSGVGEHLDLPTGTPQKLTGTATLAGRIRVVFLPDFDEQYAVQNKKLLSKSAYALNFRNGWELTDVSSEGDSTTVAVELLNAIDKAIGASQQVAEADIDRRKAIADEVAKTKSTKDYDADLVKYRQEIVRTYIKPGVYRINKPWEMDGGLVPAQGGGMLANMGLTLYQVTETQTLPAIPVGVKTLGKAKTGEVGK